MDLEEVWKIRRDRFRFFWEEIYNRFWTQAAVVGAGRRTGGQYPACI